MKKINKKENGQIIVLLAVSLVVVMMVAALAVDGGMIYSERRFAQNASDAASMAGGNEILYEKLSNDTFKCPLSSSNGHDPKQLIMSAYESARNVASINNINNLPYLGYKINGVTIEDNDINANHGVIIECYDNEAQKIIKVNTKVTSQISTAFVHLLFPGALQTTNESETIVYLGQPTSLGNAIISLSEECNTGMFGDGMNIGGSATVRIHDGGAHTNSCLIVNGLGNGLVIESDGGLNVAEDDVTLNGGTLENININQGLVAVPNIQKPECTIHDSSVKWKDVDPDDYDGIMPGEYDSVSITNGEKVIFNETVISEETPKKQSYTFTKSLTITGGEVTFKPGLYCVEGDLKITGGTVVGEGVTFYVTGLVDLVGTGSKDLPDITFSAPTVTQNFDLLFYVDGGSKGTFTVGGNNESYYSGRIFVPESTISIGGSAVAETCEIVEVEGEDVCEGATYASQFIGNQVIINGGGVIDILYNGENDPGSPPSMELSK